MRDIAKKKGVEPIAMITAYDTPTARIADEAGVDIILVGDSLGMVVLGLESTLSVKMDDMIRHTEAVARAKPSALVVGDMPFMSYETDIKEALHNAGRFLSAGADAVKIEGGSEYSDVIKAMKRAGIPVMAHVGLTPQKHKLLGGYRLMGKTASEAFEIIKDAEEVAEAGAFSIVIEFTAWQVAKEVTRRVHVPTICIGSGPYCDGQVLVIHDILGLSPSIPPFVRKYVDLSEIIKEAVSRYVTDVKKGQLLAENMYWSMKKGEYEKLREILEKSKD